MIPPNKHRKSHRVPFKGRLYKSSRSPVRFHDCRQGIFGETNFVCFCPGLSPLAQMFGIFNKSLGEVLGLLPKALTEPYRSPANQLIVSSFFLGGGLIGLHVLLESPFQRVTVFFLTAKMVWDPKRVIYRPIR